MTFGINGFGFDIFLPEAQIPPKRLYDKIEFFGDIILDDVHLLNYEFTEDDIENLRIDDIPVWDDTTLLLAQFNNNLGAGNLTNISGTIDNIDVFRREEDENILTKLATLEGDAKSYIDITAFPYKNYKYQIVAYNDTERSEPVVGDFLNIDVYNNILIDTVTNEYIVFNLNLSEPNTKNNTNYNVYEGRDRFPSILRGLQSYITMNGIQAIVIENESSLCQDNSISQDIDFMDKVKDIIENDNLKILKTRKGFLYKGKTFNYEHKPLNINITQQPYYIKFDFIQTEV